MAPWPPERRPGSPPRRRGFPLFPVAVASGTLLSIGTVLAAWWALREPEATANGSTPATPAAVRSATSVVGTSPLAALGTTAPDGAAPLAEGRDDDAIDDPVVPSDSGGLTRADVVSAINAVRPQLSRCGRDPSLIGVVRLTVSSSGRVTAAQVSGVLAGTSAGECVADVARSAVFRPSRREQTVVSWPVALGRSPSFSVSSPPETDAPAPDAP